MEFEAYCYSCRHMFGSIDTPSWKLSEGCANCGSHRIKLETDETGEHENEAD